ncbi:AsmA family protein [Silvibacterium acidisoli]|uniref:AsmA family protein n=1 Tax=Acidobacteriaceae bacterium ZG23-2 TaxID=2883246 RepID=UPI00406CD1F5
MDKRKRGLVIAGAIVVVLLVVFLIVQHLLNADTYRGRIEATLSDSLGRQVTLGHLDFSLFTGNLLAESPAIADDPAFSSDPFLTAKDVKIGVEVAPLLFHRELHITGFTIDSPKITLIRGDNGVWNYSSIGSTGKRKAPTAETNSMIPNLTVGKVDINDGTVTVGSKPQQGSPHVYENLDMDVQNFSFEKAFPFSLSGKLPAGGSVNVTGNAGPINQQDASLTPLTAQISLKHADLVAAGFVEADQGIAGVADLDMKLTSNGQTANANGKAHLTQLKLAKNGTVSAQPLDATFAVDQDLRSLSGKIDSANVQIGRAVLAANGTYQTKGNTTTTQMTVNGQNMPIDDLTAFLPSLGVQLPPGARVQGGIISTNLNIAGPTKTPTITGPVQIANTQLAGFDLGQKLSSIQTMTGAKTGSNTTIQSLTTNLRYGPEGTQTNNLNVVIAGLGSASGNGSISPSNALNYQLVVKLSTAQGSVAGQAMGLLSGVLGGGVSQTIKNGIPVTIAGTTSNPTFSANMGKLIGGAAKSQGKSIPSNPLGNALGGLLHR